MVMVMAVISSTRNLFRSTGLGASFALERSFFQQCFFWMFGQGTYFYDTGIPGYYWEFLLFGKGSDMHYVCFLFFRSLNPDLIYAKCYDEFRLLGCPERTSTRV